MEPTPVPNRHTRRPGTSAPSTSACTLTDAKSDKPGLAIIRCDDVPSAQDGPFTVVPDDATAVVVRGTLRGQSFRARNPWTSLVFFKVKFMEPNITVDLSQSLYELKILESNAIDLSLEGTFSQKRLNLSLTGTSFQSLPRCFTQTNLSLSAVTGLDFTEKPAKLSDTEFLQARRNLHDTALKNQISKSCSKAGVLICKKSGEPGSDSSMSKEESTARPHPEEKPEIAEPDAPGTPVANKSSSNGGSTAATVVGIVAGVFVVLAFIAFVVIRRRRSIRRSSDSPEAGRRRKGSAREIEMTPPARLPVSKVNQLPSSDVVSLGALGAGFLRFGTYKDERVVMMRLPAELTDVSDVKNLDTRATQLCSNPHAHIVTVIGITLLDSADYAVVAERMEKGTLSSVLKDEHTPLDAAARLKICLEVASGLDYLHRSVPKMYVRDLSSRKVLVNDDLVCKIDAFSCYLQSDRPSAIASFGAGTLAWIAPELVTRPASADLTACNVFALGVLMCHVLADHAPYQDAIETWGSTRADLRLLQQIKNGAKLLPHENATAYTALAPALRQLVDACLQVQPASRPTAQHVVNQLEALLQEEQL